jgi:hypothetical protein
MLHSLGNSLQFPQKETVGSRTSQKALGDIKISYAYLESNYDSPV